MQGNPRGRAAFHRLPLALAAAIGLGFALPAAAQTPDADWAKVVAAAKQEGRVVVYNASSAERHSALSRAFEKKYGVTVDLLNARSSEIRERIRSEQQVGRALADLTITSAATAWLQAESGTFQPHGFLPQATKLISPYKDDGTVIPISLSRYGILINTDLIKPGDEPKSWWDLTDPKWKGKILSDDPRASGGTNQAFIVLYDVLGRGFHEKLRDQDLVFGRDTQLNLRRIGRGEYPIYTVLTLPDLANVRGLPVKGIVPKEGSPYIPLVLAMLKNAPHSNAARLYMNFFLEDEAQQMMIEAGLGSPTGLKSDSIPEEFKSLTDAKAMGTPAPDQQEKMLTVMQELYTR